VPNKLTKLGPKDHPSDNSKQTSGSIAASTENCDESLDKSCKDNGTMTACVKGIESGKFICCSWPYPDNRLCLLWILIKEELYFCSIRIVVKFQRNKLYCEKCFGRVFKCFCDLNGIAQETGVEFDYECLFHFCQPNEIRLLLDMVLCWKGTKLV
jgi:hypothetical protein